MQLGSELAYHSSFFFFLKIYFKQASVTLLLYLPWPCLYQKLPENFIPTSMMCWNAYFRLLSWVSFKVTEWTWFQFTYSGVTSLSCAEDQTTLCKARSSAVGRWWQLAPHAGGRSLGCDLFTGLLSPLPALGWYHFLIWDNVSLEVSGSALQWGPVMYLLVDKRKDGREKEAEVEEMRERAHLCY